MFRNTSLMFRNTAPNVSKHRSQCFETPLPMFRNTAPNVSKHRSQCFETPRRCLEKSRRGLHDARAACVRSIAGARLILTLFHWQTAMREDIAIVMPEDSPVPQAGLAKGLERQLP